MYSSSERAVAFEGKSGQLLLMGTHQQVEYRVAWQQADGQALWGEGGVEQSCSHSCSVSRDAVKGVADIFAWVLLSSSRTMKPKPCLIMFDNQINNRSTKLGMRQYLFLSHMLGHKSYLKIVTLVFPSPYPR